MLNLSMATVVKEEVQNALIMQATGFNLVKEPKEKITEIPAD